MKYTLSKKIVYKIIISEEKEHNTKVEALPVTNLESIYDTIITEIDNKKNDNSITTLKMINQIIEEIKYERLTLGSYDQFSNKLKVYLSNLTKTIQNKNDYLWNLVLTTYHEFQHSVIQNENRNKRDILTNFYISIDCLAVEIGDYYNYNHDDFYEEILVNNYSTKKSINFFKKYPNIYKKLKIYMIKELLLNKIYFQNYDVQQHLNCLNKIIKNTKDKAELFKSYYPYSIIKTLYNSNGTFKSLSELSQTKSWNNDYTAEMKKLIISSKAYLTDIDYKTLTKEEIETLLEAILYVYNIEKEKTLHNKLLKKDIEKFKSKVETSYKNSDITEMLLSIFISKEIRNKQKIAYLELQIDKLTLLLNNKKKSKVLTPRT